MRGKIITFEGTDCSGKEIQSKKLTEKLKELGYKVIRFEFPDYTSPTGKIVGGPVLGKEHITKGWFKETSANLEPKIFSLYLAADRYYHKKEIEKYLNDNYIVILDRWCESNMGIQGGKIEKSEERERFFEWEEKLEYELLELPKPDLIIFLYMPYEFSMTLRKNRNEPLDENERCEELQKKVITSYLELVKSRKLTQVDCVENNELRTIKEIHEEVLEIVKNNLN